MIAHDLQKIVEAYSLTCLSYEKAFNKQLLDLFISDLREYSADQIAMALSNHRKDPDRGRFFPKVADVVFQIEKTAEKQDIRPLITIEWAKVIQAASHGRKPATDDQISIAALQLIGGVKSVGYAQPDELEKLKRAYAENYTALAAAQARELPKHLENIDAIIAQKTGLMKL